jgi:hypothetical protein
MKPKPIPEMVNSAQTSESHEITKVTGLKAAIQNPSFALGRKHMAHNHGSEYQVRIVRGDGTEELSGWLNSAEQVAQAIAADPKPQGKAYWVRARNVVCTECPDREERIVECPLTNIPSPRYSPHDSRYMVEVGLKSRYEEIVRNSGRPESQCHVMPAADADRERQRLAAGHCCSVWVRPARRRQARVRVGWD